MSKRVAWFEPNAVSVSELRMSLLGDGTPGRGLPGYFRAAVRSGIHFWRGRYAKLHFQRTAYWRYGYQQPAYHAEAASSVRGQSRRILGITLVPRYSKKNVQQAQKMMPVTIPWGNDMPLVFSGNTRRDILGGPFKTRGVGTRIIRGSWSGSQICWAWLARCRLKGGLTTIHPDERMMILRHIREAFSVFKAQRGNLDYRDEALLKTTGVSF